MQLWDKTLQNISNKIKPSVLDSWIKPLKAVQESENSLTLQVRNRFQKDFIEANYSDFIRRAVRETAKKDISVLFSVSRQKTLENRKNPPETIKTDSKPLPVQAEPLPKRPSFLKKYTFPSFVVGESNRLAYSAALSVCKNPGGAYNPLFLFGKRGLGKTHLLQAIGHELCGPGSRLTVRYATVEEFGTDFTRAIKSNNFDEFTAKYRNIDVLLMDDINLLADRKGFQDMFLHTFNALYLAGKQIILTSDRPPKEMNKIQSRLTNRFEQGIIAEIYSPDLELRQSILRSIAEREKFKISSSLLHYIASKVINDVRELEGAMNRLILEASLSPSSPDAEKIDNILGIYFRKSVSESFGINEILQRVCKEFKLNSDSLYGKRKDQAVNTARQTIFYIALEFTDMTATELGKQFNRNHSTVLHGHKKILFSKTRDLTLKNRLDRIITDLQEGF